MFALHFPSVASRPRFFLDPINLFNYYKGNKGHTLVNYYLQTGQDTDLDISIHIAVDAQAIFPLRHKRALQHSQNAHHLLCYIRVCDQLRVVPITCACQRVRQLPSVVTQSKSIVQPHHKHPLIVRNEKDLSFLHN